MDSPLCRLCGQKGKTIIHIIGECKCLARKEYKSRRHDNVARLANWKLCCKYGLNRNEKWYEHQPDEVQENERCKILWDMTIQCDLLLRPEDLILLLIRKTVTRQLLWILLHHGIKEFKKRIVKRLRNTKI